MSNAFMEAQLEVLALEPAEAPASAPLAHRPTGTVLNPQALIDMVMSRPGEPDVDQMERMLNLQLRWQEGEREHQRYLDARAAEQRKRDAELAFRRDFVAFRGENIVIPKTKKVQQRASAAKGGGAGPSFWQSEFHVAAEMLSARLSAHGFSVRQDEKFTSKQWTTDGATSDIPWVVVTTYLEHRDGHSETLVLEGPPDESGSKNPLQAMQSSASYLKRQSLLAITGTASGGEDDEGRWRDGGSDGGDDDDDPPPARDFYPQDRFDKNVAEWRQLIASGTKTADRLIAFIESRGQALTDEQKRQIKA